MIITHTIDSTNHSFNQGDTRCIDCQQQTFNRLLKKFHTTPEQQVEFSKAFKRITSSAKRGTMVDIHRELNRVFCKISGVSDPFQAEKRESNLAALSLYDEMEKTVEKSENPFQTALKICIAGNIMDYGVNNEFNIRSTINHALKNNFAINHSLYLQERLNNASKVLYLGDNAGEIVFDKLFIKTLNRTDVTFVTRGNNVLNDATEKDAEQTGLHEIVNVINNGYDAPSTIINKCGTTFLQHYKESDVIIAKGQGNFEGLITEKNPKIFYLMVIKCNVIAEMLCKKKGDYVVYNPFV